jgi:hypothetical protein
MKTKITQRPNQPTGYYEPQKAFTYNKDGLPVYPEHKYFSAAHKPRSLMTDSQYIRSLLLENY